MKYLKELLKFDTFTLSDAINIIESESASKKYLSEMINKGYIKKIKKNLYTCFNYAQLEDCANKFQIASNINDNSYISYHSAFEFYGFYYQMYNNIYVSTDKRFKNFEYNDFIYECNVNNICQQIEFLKGVKVTSLERTIIDSINMLGKIVDINELINCLELVHTVNEDNLIEMLNIYNKEVLYRKVGYILSLFKEEFKLSDSFFNLCKTKGIIKNKSYLINNNRLNNIYDSNWGLYVYKDLKNINNKGGNLDV